MTHFLLKVFVIEQKTSRQFAVKYNSRVLYRYVYYCVCQALPDSPESLCLSEMGGTESRDGEVGVQGQLYLNIGLHNGVLLRTVVDQVTGDLSDTRTR